MLCVLWRSCSFAFAMRTTCYPIDSVQNGTQSRPGSPEEQRVSCYCLELNPDYLAVYSIAHSLYLLNSRGYCFTEKCNLFNEQSDIFCVVTSYISVLMGTNALLKSTASIVRKLSLHVLQDRKVSSTLKMVAGHSFEALTPVSQSTRHKQSGRHCRQN